MRRVGVASIDDSRSSSERMAGSALHAAVMTTMRTVRHIRASLPTGRSLPAAAWTHRHRLIVGLLWLHVGVALVSGLIIAHDVGHAVAGGSILAGLSGWRRLGRRIRSVLASIGLLATSEVFIHFSGGSIELHFHFFVMVAVIALYQDWPPFLAALGYGIVYHGLLGVLVPRSVYNQLAAWDHPWQWAAIYGAFILAASIVGLVNWRINETEYLRRLAAQQRSANQLRAREAQLAEVQRLTGVGSWDWRPESNELFWSDDLYRILGLVPGELAPSYDAFLDRIHPEDREHVASSIAQVLASGDSLDYECRVVRPDGEERLVHVRGATPTVGNGPIWMVGVVQDVTERELAVEALRQSEARFHSLVRNSSDVITVLTPEGTRQYISSSSQRTLGYAPDELIANDVFAMVHPDDAPQLRAALAECVNDPTATPWLELRLRHRDGTWRSFEAIGANLLADPAVAGIVFNSREVTERKQAEERLREAEAMYRTLVEQLPVVVYRDAADEICTPLYVSPQTTPMLGHAPEEWLNQRDDWLTFVHPADRARIRQAVEQSVGTDQWSQEYRYMRPDGQIVWVHDDARLLRDDTGTPRYWQGTLRDITAQQEATVALATSEAQFRLLFAANPHPMWVYDRETLQFLEVNAAAVAHYGFSRDEFLAMRISDIRPLEDIQRLLDNLAEQRLVLERSEGWRHRLKDGRVIDVEILSHTLTFGDRPAVLVVAHDVTVRTQTEEALRQAEARYRALVDHAADLIAVLAPDGFVRYLSPAIRHMLGYDPDRIVGSSTFARLHPDDAELMRRLLAELIARPDRRAIAELRYRHADGTYRYLEVVGTNQLTDVAVGGLVFNARDVTDHKRMEAQLAHQALHDSLTGLPNREFFCDQLQHALDQRAGRAGDAAVLFLDLDDFKIVNDSLGHGAGDDLLRATAARLAGQLRPGDTLARFGGDEFVLLLEGLQDAAEAEAVAALIIDTLRVPVTIQGHEVVAVPSVGIAITDAATERAAEMLRRADLAMYVSKRTGKGRATAYAPALDHAAAVRLSAEADLRRAIAGEELRVVYQPVVELATKRITAVEALVRWRHPVDGERPPATFIPLAEETGLIVPLGQWVLEEACHQVQTWHEHWPNDPPLGLAVNLSPRQFRHPDLVSDIARALIASGLPAACLELEITETTALEDTAATTTMLQRLKALGVRLVIDDFGAGYAGLSYLRRCPVDALKIDRSYIAGLGLDPRDTALVRAVCAFTRPLGIKVTAEGVETIEQLAAARDIGCDRAQGFYFAPPLAADELAMLLPAEVLEPPVPLLAVAPKTDGWIV